MCVSMILVWEKNHLLFVFVSSYIKVYNLITNDQKRALYSLKIVLTRIN